MSDYAEFFAAGSGLPVSQRSTPAIFDHAVRQRPCKFPCDDPSHVHVDDLPSNRGNRSSLQTAEKPYKSSSTHLEVPD